MPVEFYDHEMPNGDTALFRKRWNFNHDKETVSARLATETDFTEYPVQHQAYLDAKKADAAKAKAAAKKAAAAKKGRK